MRAKLRDDLVDLVRANREQTKKKAKLWNCNFCPGGDDVLPLYVAEEYAGKSLLVENVTKSDVTLRLRRPWWITCGAITTGLTLIAVPHEWLQKDVTKEQFASAKAVQP